MTTMPLKLIYKNHASLIRILVLLVAFVIAFSANLFLPSLPALGQHFKTSDEDMELTITFFLLGYGFAQLIYGPLSDRLGRRKILFLGFLIGLIGSIGCLKANTISEFIFSRFILGCGVSAGSALARSILRDTFNGPALTKVVLQNGVISSIAPILTPLLGSYLDQWFGHQANLLFIAIIIAFTLLVIWIFLAETNKELDPQALYPKNVINNYFFVMKNKTFLGSVLSAGFCFAAMSAFLTISPFLFQEDLGLSIVDYGWVTAIIVSGMIIGRVINSILITWFTPRQSMKVGIALMLVGAATLLIPSLLHIMNVTVITIPILIYIIGTAFVMPLAYAKSLEPFTNFVGSAGALYGSILTLISFLVSGVVALIPSHSQTLLAVTYCLLAIATLFAFQFIESS